MNISNRAFITTFFYIPFCSQYVLIKRIRSFFYVKGEVNGNTTRLVSCPFFNVSRTEVHGASLINVDQTSFAALTVTDGVGEIQCGEEAIAVSKGDTVLVTAGSGDVYLDGIMTVVTSTL